MKLSLKLTAILLILAITFISPFLDETNNDFILTLVCLFLGIALLTYNSWSGKITYFIKSKSFLRIPLLSIIAFALVLLITNLFSATPYLSWLYSLEIFIYITIFLLLFSAPLSEKFFETFSLALIGIASILSLIGLYLYELKASEIVASTFYNPNVFAGYLLFSLPFALYFFVRTKDKRKEFLLLLVNIIIFSSLIFTRSQGAFLSFVPSFFLLLILFFKKEQKKTLLKKFLLLLIGFLILVSFLSYLKEGEVDSSLVVENTSDLFCKSRSSIIDRSDFWKGAVSMFKERPITGWGISSFSTIYPRYQPTAISYAKYTHNYYFAILGETGIFGAVTLGIFILSLIYLGLKSFKSALNNSNCKKVIASIFFLAILSSIIHSSIDFDWHFKAIFLTFFVLTGLFLNLNKEQLIKERPSFTKYFFIAFGLILFFISSILFYSSYYFKQGETLDKTGSYSSAILSYKKGTIINPSPNLLLKEGFYLFSQGDLEKAEKITKKLKKLSPENKEVWFLAGRIKTEKQDFTAEEDFEKAISASPYFINSYIELSRLYLKQEKIDEASEILDKVIEKYDENSIQYFKSHLPELAYIEDAHFKKSFGYVKLLNTIITLYSDKGRIEKIKGNNEEAEFFFKKAAKIQSFLSK